MNISDRQVRIIVSDIVTQCQGYFYHPEHCDDVQKHFYDASLKLDGILLIFPNCKLTRFIETAQGELWELINLAKYSYPELFNGSCTHSAKDFDKLMGFNHASNAA